MKSEIGECVSVLYHKTWGRTLVGNRIRSKGWWEKRLQDLINDPEVINLDLTNYPEFEYDVPIPFEQEMGWTEETSKYWLGWLQTVFENRYEHEATS